MHAMAAIPVEGGDRERHGDATHTLLTASTRSSMAASGFVGIAGWYCARKKNLTRRALSKAEEGDVGRKAIIEPLTALLNTGFAFVGPVAWTAGWFVIPLFLIGARRYLEKTK